MRAYTISNAYHTYLGRDPDSGGFDWFMHNGLSFDEMRTAFLNSTEHRSYYIESQYQDLLGHGAPDSGMSWFMSNGMSFDQIRATLLDNPEYRLREDIKGVYQAQLGRAATEAELAAHRGVGSIRSRRVGVERQ